MNKAKLDAVINIVAEYYKSTGKIMNQHEYNKRMDNPMHPQVLTRNGYPWTRVVKLATGEDYRNKRVRALCCVCNKAFLKRFKHYKKSKRHFCSHVCYRNRGNQ